MALTSLQFFSYFELLDTKIEMELHPPRAFYRPRRHGRPRPSHRAVTHIPVSTRHRYRLFRKRGPKRKDQDDSSQDGRRGSIASRLRHVTTRADERCCGSRLALHRALGPVAAPRPPRAGRAGQLAPARGLRAGRIKFSDIPQISAHADRQRGLSTDT